MSWRRLPISIYLFLEHFTGHLVRCFSKKYNLRAPSVSYRLSMLYRDCGREEMVGVIPINFGLGDVAAFKLNASSFS
jgi:hypothetical protein